MIFQKRCFISFHLKFINYFLENTLTILTKHICTRFCLCISDLLSILFFMPEFWMFLLSANPKKMLHLALQPFNDKQYLIKPFLQHLLIFTGHLHIDLCIPLFSVPFFIRLYQFFINQNTSFLFIPHTIYTSIQTISLLYKILFPFFLTAFC